MCTEITTPMCEEVYVMSFSFSNLWLASLVSRPCWCARRYGIKWKPELAQYVFGERYKFESLSGLVKSLRKSGV